ncbi:MAG: hypothetical protein ACMUHM_07585 [Thermoplasmatota archaeon]
MIPEPGRRMTLPGPEHPLIHDIEDRLEVLIGVLSKFIVERSFSEVTGSGSIVLDYEGANSMCRSIIEEASYLVGPKRTQELREELDIMIELYFKEGSKT